MTNREKMPLYKRLIFSVTLILIFLLIIEGSFSIFDFMFVSDAKITEYTRNENFTKPFQSLHELKPNSKVIYGMRPNSTAHFKLNRENFVEYQINSQGFRDREFLLEKPANLYRIAVIGDSITFGFEVPLTATYSKVLESILNQPGNKNSDKKIEVLNFGVGGYNTYNEMILLEETVLKYQPDLVILGFCMNDVANPYLDFSPHTADQLGALPQDALPNPATAIPPVSRNRFREFLQEHSHTYQNLQRWVTRKQAEKQTNSNSKFQLFYQDAVGALTRADSPESIWLAKKLTSINQLCQKNNAKFAVVVFPLYYQLDQRYAYARSHESIVEFCQQQSIPVVNLFTPFREYVLDTKQEIYVDLVHPNEIGHQLTAQAVTKLISPIVK